MMEFFLFTGLVFGISLLLLLAQRFLLHYGSCTVFVRMSDGREASFTAEGGRSLLEVLQEAGYRIPSSCGGQGSCGFCRVRLLEPAEPPYVTELPFLSPREKKRGIRLACRYRLRSDCRIEIPDHLETVRRLVREGLFDSHKRWRIRIE